MADIVRQESVATVHFDPTDRIAVGEKRFNAMLKGALDYGLITVCGSKTCELAGKTGPETTTYACRRLQCGNPAAAPAAAFRAQVSINYALGTKG